MSGPTGALMKSEAGKHINRYRQTDHGEPIVDNRSAGKRRVGDHHRGGFNALMGDGHVVHRLHTDDREWVAWKER
jgi:prepilin-type processing-associated H-X9-DG protein